MILSLEDSEEEFEITEEFVKIFQDEMVYWQGKLSLTNLHFATMLVDDNDNALARFEVDSVGGVATIFISKKFKHSRPTEKLMRKIAFHEMYEIHLCEIKGMLRKNFADYLVDQEIHKVVRVAECIMFELDYEKRFGNE